MAYLARQNSVVSNTMFSRLWVQVIVSGPRSVSQVPRCMWFEFVRYLPGLHRDK